MRRIIKELIYEFKKYERDLSKEEIEKEVYNAVKILYPGVKLYKVKELVDKNF